jgi:hypothetical protein
LKRRNNILRYYKDNKDDASLSNFSDQLNANYNKLKNESEYVAYLKNTDEYEKLKKFVSDCPNNELVMIDLELRRLNESGHANIVLINKARKYVYLIEPHVRNDWTNDVLNLLIDILGVPFSVYDYRTLGTDRCPTFFKLQTGTNDAMCQSWVFFITYIYLHYNFLKTKNQINVSEVIDSLTEKGLGLLRNRIIEFLYYIEDVIKNDVVLFDKYTDRIGLAYYAKSKNGVYPFSVVDTDKYEGGGGRQTNLDFFELDQIWGN